MPLEQDRANLKMILTWVFEVLHGLVSAFPEQRPTANTSWTTLVTEMRLGLPTIKGHIDEAIKKLDNLESESEEEWKRLKERGLTDEQLQWKLSLLRATFAKQEKIRAHSVKKRSWVSRVMASFTGTIPLAKTILGWINMILESYGLDIVKEFKDGVELVIDTQLGSDTLITIGEPREWK